MRVDNYYKYTKIQSQFDARRDNDDRRTSRNILLAMVAIPVILAIPVYIIKVFITN